MVWYALNPLRFRFLVCVVQEEVDQDSVEVGFGMLSPNLSLEQFDTPDTATSQLQFPRVTAFYGLKLSNVL